MDTGILVACPEPAEGLVDLGCGFAEAKIDIGNPAFATAADTDKVD